MKLTKKTIDLICELEEIIGSECYNPNSLNGYTMEEGCSYRYPVHYIDKTGSEMHTRYNIVNMDADHINTIKYKFGSNHLYIGLGIERILDLLEKRYKVDFSK